MKVSFNPAISFRQNLIEQRVAAQQAQTGLSKDEVVVSTKIPQSKHLSPEESEKADKEFKEMLEEGKSIDGIIKGTHWEKKYNPFNDTVHLKIPNSYDGNEYTVYPDGKVVVTNGWGRNEVEVKANEKMAKYVKAMKEGKVDEFLEELKQAEEKQTPNGNYMVSDKSKTELFRDALHNRQWKKEYLPESDIIAIRHKKIKDSVEYMIEKDGTVKECGLRIKPTVIIEPSVEGAKEFGKLKAKLSGEEDKTQKSLWYKTKNVVANVWKFFQVTSTMAGATTKGIAEGLAVGTGVLASAWILRGGYNKIVKNIPLKEIAQTPFKTAGKAGILISAAAGAAVLAAEVIAGRMKANQQSAVIEHKLDVAHDLS